ncbi:probable protein phosphatase 2C 4 [Dioscorea cayenensis subsp. rotundata]|uniref:protein-serine/threonine phosphatase n=1 Tax=Dioscorea cayennensis subsp. rotundata TaxID=55577 RepID=A0AB40D3I0_DIOCR|nr:probable protein phosphatase 2C 4 [Dioscorea cayenensis subsp. rotundata]
MGNAVPKLSSSSCFSFLAHRRHRRGRRDAAAVSSEPCDEGFGHSFCYVRPDIKLDETTTFRTISGAAVSANTSTPPSTSDLHAFASQLTWPAAAAAFESSTSFSSVPLQPVPRFSSGPLSGPLAERGFLSGPIERGFLSGPIDPRAAPFSGPLEPKASTPPSRLQRNFSRRAATNLLRGISKAISRSISVKRPIKSESLDSSAGSSNHNGSSDRTSDDTESLEPTSSGNNLQWAQGKAGEDRVHVVISEEHGWVFVGIYDGFNGPDATDYLLSNLYSSVQHELKGLLWDDNDNDKDKDNNEAVESQQRAETTNHPAVLHALSQALMKTEEAYLSIADNKVLENPELALMGSCVLVMLMKGEDVYLMSVGDSRAVLAHKNEERWELGMISEEAMVKEVDDNGDHYLAALQLTLDHSASVQEEVHRIRNEHPDDCSAIVNDRVKGSLKVTRAFGAGFLKQPKWNNALLEMFQIDYVGNAPYLSCTPFLCHHKLASRDRFLILSSDGLYQYFTNEEVVSQVELFMSMCPEGDPAQHLIEEVLFRAAEKAGMDFHELLEIPQGDRRRYHDDVSIIVISFEGMIWRSCV